MIITPSPGLATAAALEALSTELVSNTASAARQFSARVPGGGNTHEVFCNALESYMGLLELAIAACQITAGAGKVFSEELGSTIDEGCDALIGECNTAVDTWNRVCVLEE